MMSTGVDINQEMSNFCAHRQAVDALVFVDTSASMVLATASKKSERQELLDMLAKQATTLLGEAATTAMGALAPNDPGGFRAIVSATGRDLRLFVSGPRNSGEALALILRPSADLTEHRSALVALATLIWPAGET